MGFPGRFIAIYLVGVLSGIAPLSALAHSDAPGPPPIQVRSTALDLQVNHTKSNFWWKEGVYDGFFSHRAELLLYTTIGHNGHEVTDLVLEKSLKYDSHPFHPGIDGLWEISIDSESATPGPPHEEVLSDHNECTPRNNVVVVATVVELDNGSRDVLLSALGGVAQLAVAGLVLGTGPVGLGLAAVAFVVRTVLVGMNGQDDLGTNMGLLPANGILELETVGSGWDEPTGTTVRYEGVTTELADGGECDSPEFVTLITPTDAGAAIYQPLRDALAQVPLMEAESDIPDPLTAAEMDDVKTSLTAYFVDTGELAAAGAVQDAAIYMGADNAITIFEMAQSMAAFGQTESALHLYESAYVAGHAARLGGVTAPTALLPFQVVLTPSFMSASADRDFAVVAMAAGGAAVGSLAVANVPTGMNVSVTQFDASVPVFKIHIETEGVTPGTYALAVTANDGITDSPEKTLTVVVNEADEVPDGPPLPTSRVDGLIVLIALLGMSGLYARKVTIRRKEASAS